MNKKLLFDLVATQPIGDVKRHGGGKYGEVILKRIIQKKLPVTCYFDSSKWLNPEIRAILNDNNIVLYDIQSRSLSDILKDSDSSIIYSALPNRQLLMFSNCKVIGTIHGLRRLETPADSYIYKYKNSSWKDWLIYLYRKHFPHSYIKRIVLYKEKEWANPNFHFVTVSYHSQCSLYTFFPTLKNKEIKVFYSPSTSQNIARERMFDEKYFMLVSAKIKDKNNLRAIEALDKLFDNGFLSDFMVKITGAESSDIFRYKIRNKKRFEFLGYVDEKTLDQLYHDAYALIYPSLNEGFGYPPLEAMHYGVPVVASPFTSIPEVCESAALYFNPLSVEEIAARILRMSDGKIRKIHSERAISQYNIITKKQNEDLDGLIDYIYGNTI